jgi:hypothetical protein
VFCAFALTLLLAAGVGAMGPSLTYVEDFRTTQFKDEAVTTAVWSTATGELKLIPFDPVLLGSYTDTGYARGVAVAGDVACVASSDLGLLTFDIHNPSSPLFLARLATAGSATGVVISGTTAFVADEASGLHVIDIAHPASPVLRGSYPTLDPALGVAVDGRYAYVATRAAGLTIVDVSVPTAPALVSRLATVYRAVGVAVAGGYAFVADDRAGLTVIDVSDPAAPVLRDNIETSTAATGVAVWGNLVGVTVGEGGLQLFDATMPAHPTALGGLRFPGSATSVTFHGELAYVTTTAPGLYAVQVMDPASPVLKWSRSLEQPARAVVTAGDVAYVAADRGGLVAVLIGETTDGTLYSMPAIIGAFASTEETHHPRGMAVSGDVVCLAADPYGLVTLSIANPAAPTVLGSATTPGDAIDVAVAGDLACVADSLSGLRVFNIDDPAGPVALGGCDTPGQAVDVAIAGRVAYVADGTGGLRLISLANPAWPSLLGACSLPGAASAVALSGNIACVTDGALRLVNVANPAAPTLVGSYTGLGGEANGVVLAGSIAWVTAGTLGLCAIDIHDPAAPTLIGSYVSSSGYSLWSPVVFGDQVLVIADYPGSNPHVEVIAIGNPAAPSRAGICNPNVGRRFLAADGDLAFVSYGQSGAGWFGGIKVLQLAQSDVSGAHVRAGGSLDFVGGTPYIVRARLTVNFSGFMQWRLNFGDGGEGWGTTWQPVSASVASATWEANLVWNRSNPTATYVCVDWRLQEARIDSIVDVRNDQGGWVNMYFTCSGYDFPYSHFADKVSGYTVFRQVESALLAARVQEAWSRQASLAKGSDATTHPPRSVEVDGATYVVNDGAQKASPSGVWSIVANFYSRNQDQYVVTLPTTADDGPDGPVYTKFYVSARGTTAEEYWYDSVADSGRSVDNLAPPVPTGFAVAYYTGSGNQLTWDASSVRDFRYFRIYRGNEPDFVPSTATLVRTTTATSWTDPEYSGGDVYYKITALDYVENESEPASPETVTDVAGETVPLAFALHANVPNPFNPITTIRYDLPAAGPVRLAVYDVAGRLVRVLVAGERAAGSYEAVWDGRDQSGRSSPSGSYLARLVAGGKVEVVRMGLVR